VGRCGVTGNGVIARYWAQGFRDDLVPRPDPQSPLGLVRLDPAYLDASRTTTGRVKASVSGNAPPSRSAEPNPVVAVGARSPMGAGSPYAKQSINLAALA
jgi:hypothetical protein